MEGESSAQRLRVSFPIQGMERVVATVTGYSGTQRFDLIKLISKAGGNYVGTMSQSITHLVCWKYEGTKYQLARKFKTLIVNHQWVEDCIKAGRRLQEHPYTFQCGQEVEPLMLNVSLIFDKPEESHAPQKLLSQKKRNSALPEPFHRSRRRRLVKKNLRQEVLNLISDSEEESTGQEGSPERQKSVDVSNHLVPRNECKFRALHACDSTCYEGRHNRNEGLNDDDDIEEVNDVLELDDGSLHVKGASSYHVNGIRENRNDIETTTKLPTSMELSCVICWTDFSATRGVLPCGHRFCFSCIQNWADYMTSSQKTSTCPLCKAPFSSITKVDDAVSLDQKIYSQTIPEDGARMDIYILPVADTRIIPSHSSGAPVCCHCSCREPEDLLQRCNLCQIQCIHSYCLDPPLLPWTCGNCKDLQRLYLHIR